MTVVELIRLLKEQPQSAQVLLVAEAGPESVESVKQSEVRQNVVYIVGHDA